MNFHRILDIAPYNEEIKAWQVIVETPRESRHKYKYDPDNNVFGLHRTLPGGMAFPFDFGFLPGTAAEDGDPLDVLVIMNDGTFPGCLVAVRLVGVMEATQTETNGEEERNDRLIGVPMTRTEWKDTESAKELDGHLLQDVEEFFTTYNRLDGKRFKVLRVRGPHTAEKMARAGMKLFKKNEG